MSEPAPEAFRALLAEAQRERGLSWGDLAAQVGIHRDAQDVTSRVLQENTASVATAATASLALPYADSDSSITRRRATGSKAVCR